MHEPSSRPFARREHNVVGRKTVSVEGHWDFEQAAKLPSFKISEFCYWPVTRRQGCFELRASRFETLILRCVEEWLTMCNVVVIIKRFRELSLACLCTAVLLDAQPALATGSGKFSAEL